MKRCPHCQRRFPPNLNFCPKDGTPLGPAPESDDPLLGETLLGQFEICERLGAGSMGTVYKAWQETMERHVAVKIMRPEMVGETQVFRRFQREARAAARLSHPNIITVHLVGETKDRRPFIVMEYLEGESLEDLLQREGALAPIRVLHLTRQITAALAEAHAHDVIHRDLKPANIHLVHRRTAVDQVKVLDFGIAKILQESEESQITQTGAIFGTPYYLSPEQASGAQVDHRSDIYSLGVMLFRLLTGKVPFDAANGMEVVIKHLKEPPPRPRHIVRSIPEPLEALVLETLAKSPDDRVQSAALLGQRLEAIMAALYPGAPAPVGLPITASDPPQSTRPASQPFITLAEAEAPWDQIADPQDGPAGAHTMQEAQLIARRPIGKHLVLTLLALLLGTGLGFGAHVLRPRAEISAPPIRTDAAPARPDAKAAHEAPPADAQVQADTKAPARLETPTKATKKKARKKKTRKKKTRKKKARKKKMPKARVSTKPRDAGAPKRLPQPKTAPIAPLPSPTPQPPHKDESGADDHDDDHGSAVPVPGSARKPPAGGPYELLN